MNEHAKCHLLLYILKAIHLAHSNGIIHNDLHPGNIMMCTEETLPLITDWGAAWIENEDNITSKYNHIVGTYYSHPKISIENDALFRRNPQADLHPLGKMIEYDMKISKNDQILQQFHKMLIAGPNQLKNAKEAHDALRNMIPDKSQEVARQQVGDVPLKTVLVVIGALIAILGTGYIVHSIVKNNKNKKR
jgi:serine/threonine protein kinase